jgi:hypothetical protein
LVVEPDIQLSILTAAGLPEPRADSSQAAQTHIDAAVHAELEQRNFVVREFNADTAMEGRAGQLIRLHDVVGQSILAFHYGYISLPTKVGKFDWTLGPGTQEIDPERTARYALFVRGQGSYSSAGRVVMALLFGGAMSGQSIFASLVDLQTGNIIWFNVALAAPDADMREADGAASLVRSLFKDAPL